jgi:hypothetical protein
MGNKKSTAAGKSSGAQLASAYSRVIVKRSRVKVQMVQNVLLIWLDNNIDDNSNDCRNTITQLRRAVNTINTFTDGEACIQFLEDMQNDKACMIISGALGHQIVSRVHNMSPSGLYFHLLW